MNTTDTKSRSLDTDRLAKLIGVKRELLKQMRGLADRQTEIIAKNDITRLLSVLGAKQTLLVQLRKVEQQLDPFRSQSPESRQWRSESDRTQCRQSAQECERLLNDILCIEQECETDLSRRRDDVGAQLQTTHSSAQAAHAYAAATRPAAHCVDLSSDK